MNNEPKFKLIKCYNKVFVYSYKEKTYCNPIPFYVILKLCKSSIEHNSELDEYTSLFYNISIDLAYHELVIEYIKYYNNTKELYDDNVQELL